MRRLHYLVFLLSSLSVLATDHYPRNEAIDIRHYRFRLSLNDTTNFLAGKASVTVFFNKAITEFELDLANLNSSGEGMKVNQVAIDGVPVKFIHQHDRLKIILPSRSAAGQSLQVDIDYGGIPQDGLIISINKFGDRTFFGDNWPNRAHHWLPCVDHPSDKATCEFIVIAPERYSVVSNGTKTEESSLPGTQKLTRWMEDAPIPMKVMVIGVARFAIQRAGLVDHIPVESWVYPQNREEGFSDYAVAPKVLNFFHHHIGPYPYEKLANVQSKTRYGGMENASCIFYSENSVDGKNNDEDLIAHEVAHQWFGNSASENDWHHVWLSEGFATYFSHLYSESVHGRSRLVKEMSDDRVAAVNYSRINSGPVIDTTVTDWMNLLNANSYQKGGWVLHMLRHEMGDLLFWNGIQRYYERYQNSNAMTRDFQQVMEETSGKDLAPFFDQWLRKGGQPVLSGEWTYNPKSRTISLTLRQDQAGTIFSSSLDLGIRMPDGSSQAYTVRWNRKSQEFSLPVRNKPLEVVADPDTWLLFEGKIEAR